MHSDGGKTIQGAPMRKSMRQDGLPDATVCIALAAAELAFFAHGEQEFADWRRGRLRQTEPSSGPARCLLLPHYHLMRTPTFTERCS